MLEISPDFYSSAFLCCQRMEMITNRIIEMGNFGDEILCEACRKSAGEDKIFTTKKAADFGGFSHGHGTGKLFAAQIFQTAHADIFPLEGCNVPGIPTKNAGGLVLIQDDRRPVHINLQGVALRDVQGTAELDG